MRSQIEDCIKVPEMNSERVTLCRAEAAEHWDRAAKQTQFRHLKGSIICRCMNGKRLICSYMPAQKPSKLCKKKSLTTMKWTCTIALLDVGPASSANVQHSLLNVLFSVQSPFFLETPETVGAIVHRSCQDKRLWSARTHFQDGQDE